MSTCLSLVCSHSDALVTTPTVCWLLQYMTGVMPVLKLSWSKRLFHYISSEAARLRAYSSALVVNLATDRCLMAFQSIGIPKSLKR
jgi:hypothetical protein